MIASRYLGNATITSLLHLQYYGGTFMARKKTTQKKSLVKRKSQRRLRAWMGWVAVAFIVLFAVVIYAFNQTPVEIGVDKAYQEYQAGTFFLDVRTQDEWNEYHIPGTTLIPLDELSIRVNELPKDQSIIVVCRSGNRSQEGRDILLEAGFDDVVSMAGGVSTWRSLGYPIEP